MAPLAWIRRIMAELPEFNTIPLFGNAPPFDWSHLSTELSQRFQSISRIHPREEKWKERSDWKRGLGRDLHQLCITLSPLGSVYWLISKEDLEKGTHTLLKSSGRVRAKLSEPLQEGFYRFLALEALDTIQSMAPFSELTIQLTEEEPLFERAFCIDVELQLGEKSCWGRLAIPEEFRKNWLQHFSAMPSSYFPTERSRQTFLSIGVKMGSVTIDPQEWEAIRPGDFVLLDSNSSEAEKPMGVCLLTLESTPLFNAKIKRDRIELIDYAFYYEETMQDKRQDKRLEPSPEETEKEIVALRELPVVVTVEIARLKMSLDQLMHLTPGNTLELPIHPDQAVSLTVGGEKVGRAELLYLGEQLGIRILEI